MEHQLEHRQQNQYQENRSEHLVQQHRVDPIGGRPTPRTVVLHAHRQLRSRADISTGICLRQGLAGMAHGNLDQLSPEVLDPRSVERVDAA
jgi:hypothetical protein